MRAQLRDSATRSLIAEMQGKPDDLSVQVKGCGKLLELERGKNALAKSAHAAKAIQAVCNAMRGFVQHLELQMLGAEFILAMVAEHGENLSVAGREGAISCVINAMRVHASDRLLQARGCCALLAYSNGQSDDHTRQLLQERALEVVVLPALSLALQARPNQTEEDRMLSEAIKKPSYKIISGVLFLGNQLGIKTPQHNGLILLLRAMATHTTKPDLLCDVIQAVYAVLLQHDQEAKSLGKSCAKLIFECLQANEDREELHSSCMAVLFRLAEIHECKVHLHDLCSVPKVICIMKRFDRSSNMQCFGTEFLHTLMRDPSDMQSRALFIEHGGVRAVVSGMKAHGSHQQMQIIGCYTFYAVTFEQRPEAVPQLLDLGVESALFNGMRACKHNSEVVAKAAYVLMLLFRECRITVSRIGKLADLEKPVLRLAFECMVRHMQSTHVQIHCADLLETVFQGDDHAQLLAEVNAFQTFVKSMKMHMDCEDVLNSLCCTITVATVENRPNQDLCRKIGVIQVTLQALDRYKTSSELVRQVRRVLHALSNKNDQNTALVKSLLTPQQIKRLNKVEHAFASPSDDAFHKEFARIFSPRMETETLFSAVINNHVRRAYEEETTSRTQNDVVAQAKAEYDHQKMLEKCVVCGKSAGELGTRLLKCSACTVAPMYCSAECQKAGWPGHKAECKVNRKALK